MPFTYRTWSGSDRTQLANYSASGLQVCVSADGSAIYFYQHRPATSFRKLSLPDGQITELTLGWEWGTHNFLWLQA